jgi:hypothetical protein
MLKKNIWASFQRIIEQFTQKIVIRLSNLWVWETGSGKNLFRIPDPGFKKAPDPGSRICNTARNAKIVSQKGKKGRNFHVEELSIGLEASPGAVASFVGV